MDQAARIARNEALARVVNEQIGELNASGAQLPAFEVLCECGSSHCMEPISVAYAEYESVRADPLTFIIKPGHAIEAVETVVVTGPGFEVVRKKPGVSGRIALESDPRA
jgi:hypothetical protein